MESNKDIKPFFSIAIPTYEMGGSGVEFLEYNFKKINDQTFNNFEVVISDHSVNDDIKLLCDKWVGKLKIKYYKNTDGVGKSSSNINHAIKHCTGEWIKIIFQDDFLYSDKSLQIIYNDIIINKDIKWVVTACEHTNNGVDMYRPFYPKWNDKMHKGINTFSSPSVLCIKNDGKLLFDDNLVWLMDVEYYKRMFDKYGEPHYIQSINVVNRTWSNSVSNTLSDVIKNKEIEILIRKYGE
tara:strand:+ start:398 stop:1114 length:717 start_codon:yes stop_codon:yes gene_type:complete